MNLLLSVLSCAADASLKGWTTRKKLKKSELHARQLSPLGKLRSLFLAVSALDGEPHLQNADQSDQREVIRLIVKLISIEDDDGSRKPAYYPAPNPQLRCLTPYN